MSGFQPQRRRCLTLPAALAACSAAPALPAWAQNASTTGAAGPGTSTAQAQTAPPSAAEFFAHPAFDGAQLSPDGQKVAFRLRVEGRPARLVVLDIATRTPTVVASFEDESVGHFSWVNPQRLVFNLAVWLKPGPQMAVNAGLFAVDADGERFRQLAETLGGFSRASHDAGLLPQWTRLLRTSTRQDSDEVWVVVTEALDKKVGADHHRVHRLNTRTGRWQEEAAPTHASHWVFDTRDRLRAASVWRDGRQRLLWREAGSPGAAEPAWQTLGDFDSLQAQVLPVYIDPRDTLYVHSNLGQDKTALHVWDFAARAPATKAVIASPDFDLHPTPVTTGDALLGWRFLVDADSTHWVDEGLKALQARLDQALPGSVNRLAVAGQDRTHVLVHTRSDRSPGTTLLYNTGSRQFVRLGDAMPGLRGRAMGRMQGVQIKTRDGRQMPAWLSLPPGEARRPLPLVVWVHGGPWVRGQQWGWDAEVQFLTSRGYAVLQPEFRGSTGFGRAHFEAGWRQWGQAMQDDLDDAAQWAVTEGLADPRRIGIYGASYGGYAALMALVRHPQRFRCAVSAMAVTDPAMLYTVRWSDTTDAARIWTLPHLLGDPERDAALLRENAPVHQASRIDAPVLLAFGARDERVPLIHGEKMRDALAARPRPAGAVEWVIYPEEGHGLVSLQARTDFWERVERFLGRHLAG